MSDAAVATGKVRCGHCRKEITYPLSKAGLTGKCPGCKNPLTLPASQAATHLIEVPSLPIPELALQRAELIPAAQVSHSVPAMAVPQRVESPANRFMSDGQNPDTIYKLLKRVTEICTSTEEPLYMAVQQKPVANLAPDAVVLTNRRVIIFRQKMLGRMDFVDVLWLQVGNVHMKENLIGATLTVTGMNGHVEQVDYVPKEQARRVYRIAQEREEEAIELRRQRMMEEQRNAAGGVVVNAAISAPSPTPLQTQAADDPVARLGKLKAMFDNGLISEAEFNQTKARILSDL